MKKLLTYILFLFSLALVAQEKDKNLPKGNDSFKEKKYADAEVEYRISQSKFDKKAKASYNLGTSIYKQKQSAEAKQYFAKAANKAKTRPEKHVAFHNLGNCFMNEKNYSEAVNAYENALRNNPRDEKTRYNYALAKKNLENNPPTKNEGDKDKKNKKEEKEPEKKDKQKDKQKDNNNGNKPNNQNSAAPKPSKGEMSKQQLQRLLDAVNKEEKKVQEKVNYQKAKINPTETEKDW